MKTGAQLIAAERKRQIEEEGWTAEHDDKHVHGELIQAGMLYANRSRQLLNLSAAVTHILDKVPFLWPWQKSGWKPSPDPVRNLVKAGALLAAEIDRLQRLQP